VSSKGAGFVLILRHFTISPCPVEDVGHDQPKERGLWWGIRSVKIKKCTVTSSEIKKMIDFRLNIIKPDDVHYHLLNEFQNRMKW